MAKESKKEAGDHQDNGDDSSRDSDLSGTYCSGGRDRDIVSYYGNLKGGLIK